MATPTLDTQNHHIPGFAHSEPEGIEIEGVSYHETRLTSPEATQALKEYLENLKVWKAGGKEFIGNATEVERSLKQRVDLMAIIAKESVLDHEDLKPYKAYIIADRAALAKPDLAEEAYERFQERRDTLRDSLKLETHRISAEEYRKLALNIQGAMQQQDFIDLHRDFIGIRKEIAQENSMHPRFVAEVAMGEGALFDELLVDLDRGDLRETDNKAWIEDSKIRAGLFSEKVASREQLQHHNSATRVQAFSEMIAIGKQIIHDPLAIKEFAETQADIVGTTREAEYTLKNVAHTPEVLKARDSGWNQIGGKNYEIGMAALENKKFSPEMTLSFFQAIKDGAILEEDQRHSIFGSNTPGKFDPVHAAKDPVTMFRAANAAFAHQFNNGDAKAGLSYAVMEYTARQIMNDQKAIQRMANVDLDAAQAVEQFRAENKATLEKSVGGQNFEEKVLGRMQKGGSVYQETSANISGSQPTKDGPIDLAEILAPKSAMMQAFVGENGSIVIAASEEGYKNGDTVVLKGPFSRHDGGSLDIGQGKPAGTALPLYVQFEPSTGEPGSEPSVLIASSKEALEQDEYIQVPDSFTVSPKKGTQSQSLGSTKALASPGAEKDSIRNLLLREGPYIQVETGGSVHISATEADFLEGRKASLSLYGIKVPPPGKDHATKDDAYDAGQEAKNHLEGLIATYGKRGMRFNTIDGRDGQKELVMRLKTGEDASYRMIRDGYALPSECETLRSHREAAAEIASRGDKGLWANGFPDDDGSWRSETLMPHLTRRDKRENLKKTVVRSMAGSAFKAGRIFSDRSSTLFALDLKLEGRWEHPSFYREAWEAAQANPDRMRRLYENNVKLMKELRGRKDNLSEDEKVSHDRLNIGARLIGRALVNVGEKIDPKTGKKSWKYVSPMDVIKDTEPMLSKRGMQIPKTIKDTFNKGLDVGAHVTKKGMEAGSAFSKYVLGTAAEFS